MHDGGRDLGRGFRIGAGPSNGHHVRGHHERHASCERRRARRRVALGQQQAPEAADETEHGQRPHPGEAGLGSGAVTRPLALDADAEADESGDREPNGVLEISHMPCMNVRA